MRIRIVYEARRMGNDFDACSLKIINRLLKEINDFEQTFDVACLSRGTVYKSIFADFGLYATYMMILQDVQCIM